MRTATIHRATRETDIKLSLNLDGGAYEISTGIGFFDHMLTSFAVHSGIGLNVLCKGDLEVDCHHTIEDVGIVLGQALAEALGDYAGIARYGNFYIPMDESLALCALDLGGRPFLVFDCDFFTPMIGDFDTQMAEEFFRAVAMHANITLHLQLLYGKNDHHKCEALFKAFAHALRQAITPTGAGVLSSKGVL